MPRHGVSRRLLAAALAAGTALVGGVTLALSAESATARPLSADPAPDPRSSTIADLTALVGATPADDRVALLLEPSADAPPARRAALARRLGGRILSHSSSFAVFVKVQRGRARATLATWREEMRREPDVRELAPVLYLAGNRAAPLVPTGDLFVRFRATASAAERRATAQEHGLDLAGLAGVAPRTWRFRASGPEAALRAAGRLAAEPGVRWAHPDYLHVRALRAVPNDPLFPSQWHLLNTGQASGAAGADLDVVPAWDSFRGSADEIIAIVDDGLEIAHADLSPNVVPGQSWNFENDSADPSPSTGDDHGTACGGAAAARGFNGTGVSGVAPQAGLVGYKMLDADTDANEAEALTRNLGLVDILSNSWGPADDRHLEGPWPLAEAALQDGVTDGRGGRGAIYVWAGGNGRQNDDNVNFDGYANSRYTIAVGATTNDGTVAYYSEDGAPLLVNAPSSGGTLGITTVDRTGSPGYSAGDYTSAFGGTSASCPLVAGAVALVLQANPELGWRDVQAILATTARRNDPAHPDWTTNSAGHYVNHAYGFGTVDAAAAVAAAALWTPLGPEITAERTATPDVAIPDNSATGVSSTVTITDDISVEWADVWFTASHSKWSQLEVVLTSPDGTESVLATAAQHAAPSAGYNGWRFGTARLLGESSQGTWTLTVRDLFPGTSGTLDSWTLKTYGAAPADTLAPETTDDYDGSWRRDEVTVSFSATDEGSGVALTEYRVDGGEWQPGASVTLRTWKRGGNSGLHQIDYRSVDVAGNVEPFHSVVAKLDRRPPYTIDDADALWHALPTTVHFTAVDALAGGTITWFAVDSSAWQTGDSVIIPAPADGSNDGAHTVWYYSVDALGNREPYRSCTVLIDAAP